MHGAWWLVSVAPLWSLYGAVNRRHIAWIQGPPRRDKTSVPYSLPGRL